MQVGGGLRKTFVELVLPGICFASEGNRKAHDEGNHQITLQLVVQRSFLGSAC